MSRSADRQFLKSQGMQDTQRYWDNYSGTTSSNRQRSWIPGGAGGSARDQNEFESNMSKFSTPKNSFIEAEQDSEGVEKESYQTEVDPETGEPRMAKRSRLSVAMGRFA